MTTPFTYKCGECGLLTQFTSAQAAEHHAACRRPEMFSCCTHCGCPPGDQTGHDDTYAEGCNDPCTCESGLTVHDCQTGPKVRPVAGAAS